MRGPVLRLWFALLASLGLYATLARYDAINGPGPVLGFLAILGALFGLYALAAQAIRCAPTSTPTLWIVGLGAVAFRVALLPAGLPPSLPAGSLPAALASDTAGREVAFERFLLYDDDLWRYLWDGHVLAHGGNPYAAAPADPLLDTLAELEVTAVTDGRTTWADVRDNVNHPETPTIYPPLAQVVFLLSHALAPGSVLVMKAILAALDLLAAVFIALALRATGQPPALALLYAWNPIVVKVFAGSGHVDALAAALVALLALAVLQGRRTLAAAAFCGAVLAKVGPLVLLPFLLRRLGFTRSVLASLVVAAGLVAQHLAAGGGAGGLGAFAGSWEFNAGLFALAKATATPFFDEPALVARGVSALVLLGVLQHLFATDDGSAASLPRTGAMALGALLLLSPAVMPWYVTWLLPLAVIAGLRAWLFVSGLLCLAFLVMVDGAERPLVLAVEHGFVLAVLFFGGSHDHSFLDPRRALARGLARLRPGVAILRGPGVA